MSQLAAISGDGLTWLIVLAVMGAQVFRALKQGGKGAPGAPPVAGSPEIEDFLRRLAQGENPMEPEATENKAPAPQPRPTQAAPTTPPVIRTVPGREPRQTSSPPVKTGRPAQRAAPPPPPPPIPQRHKTVSARTASPQAAPTVQRRAKPPRAREQREEGADRPARMDGAQTRRVRGMLRRQDSLRSAILLREILGPPVSSVRR